MQNATNTLSLTSIPWWAWFFPEYALQPKQLARAIVEEIREIPEKHLHVANSMPIILLHEEKRYMAKVTLTEIGTFMITVPEEKCSSLHAGDCVEVDVIKSRFFDLNKHVVASLH